MEKSEIEEGVSESVVRFVRGKERLTLKKLGEILHLSESKMSRVENGERSLRIIHLVRLANYLNMRLSSLFTHVGM